MPDKCTFWNLPKPLHNAALSISHITSDRFPNKAVVQQKGKTGKQNRVEIIALT